jgi:tripartite-type tricarboxylate transporter receptor subunit TctC
VVSRVAAEVAKICQQPAVKQQFAQLGIDLVPQAGPEFTTFIAQQRAAIAAIVKDRKIQFED